MFGFNGVLLCLYQPYKDWEISLAEAIAMLALSLLEVPMLPSPRGQLFQQT